MIDWKAGRPSPAALVEAVLLPDSLVYRAQTDSSGNFRLGPVPRGEYLVFGVIDANRNLRREPREAFDSNRVVTDSGRTGDLYAFIHDTLPPRIQTVAPNDSVTATITFAAPLDPALQLDTASVSLRKLPELYHNAESGHRTRPRRRSGRRRRGCSSILRSPQSEANAT